MPTSTITHMWSNEQSPHDTTNYTWTERTWHTPYYLLFHTHHTSCYKSPLLSLRGRCVSGMWTGETSELLTRLRLPVLLWTRASSLFPASWLETIRRLSWIRAVELFVSFDPGPWPFNLSERCSISRSIVCIFMRDNSVFEETDKRRKGNRGDKRTEQA